MQPGKDDHQRLHELWGASTSALVVWRPRHQMPPNDPRVLSISEEDMLDDLLVLAFVDLRAEIAARPSLGEQTNPERRQQWEAAQRAIDAGDTGTLNADLEKLARALGKPPPKPVEPSPVSPAPSKGKGLMAMFNPWGPDA